MNEIENSHYEYLKVSDTQIYDEANLDYLIKLYLF